MTSTPLLQHFIEDVSDRMTSSLQNIIPSVWDVPVNLKESMTYSLLAGGKRLRPLLVIAACEALKGNRDAAIEVACSVEMVHTYSLIHDDLPAMDNDDYRRGKLTNHKVYGEAMAILAGDGLLTHAFYHLSQIPRKHGIPADQVLTIIEELSEMSGPRGMVGGQVADMEGEQGLTDLSQLEYIHLHKTSDLIIFSLMAGGRIAGAEETKIEALRTFGEHLGLAFQIQDDILDLIGDEAKLGKKTQSDIKQDKVTYPFFIGLENSQMEVKRHTEEAKKIILNAQFPYPELLLEIADYLVSRDH
ncbi:polyprenyl synthetase family protein [Paenibacillus crassostreae]|uniref:Farnesyl diphosphate synthase n=1 Tax=Paenibacillus crassostreae TaxID=1763538 RepID=A0A167DHT2_9BACL|nr:farnesyl diphosphate synthase [Paenibacillus crassostreae]AOZ91451.1 polyprenyl synthetase [Paenibacillus crassostreae]OAB74390.1 polyprenyl synthetase [Paenibacillus crassostreae]